MSGDTCDVLIVGGGIHGVGVAQAAAAAGYEVLLVEQSGLASGTSSKSSKLIHGGLRYLEYGHVGLVRESLRERELLLRLAPELVRRQAFFVPIYPQTTRPAWKIRLGLMAYAALAGLGREARFRTVPRSEWSRLDGLQTERLQTVLQYWDAQTDDRQLTRAVMASAMALGARLWCPANFVGATLHANGCDCQIHADGREVTIQSRVVVNAAGPWASRVLTTCHTPLPALPVELVQGTHLELPDEVSSGCYYVESPDDRRAVFVIPWQGRTMVGTTEVVYQGDPGQVRPLEEERDYLLRTFRCYFPLRNSEVLSAWAGLRVLPRSSSASGSSRETQLPVDRSDRPRWISVFGGKLTGYRATAEKVIRRIAPSLPTRLPRARTDQLRLSPPPTSP